MKIAKITENLKNKIIKRVLIPTNVEDKYISSIPGIDNNSEIEFDSEYFYIELDSGEILEVWNSEWGGGILKDSIDDAIKRRDDE